MKRIYLDQVNIMDPLSVDRGVTVWDELNWRMHESTWLIKKPDPARKWAWRLLR